MKLAAQSRFGTVATVAVAVFVTSQAFNTPAKPYKAKDIVPASGEVQAQFAMICQMYPAECQFSADGSVARVIGRRVAPGTDRAVLRHFQTEIVPIRDASWGAPR